MPTSAFKQVDVFTAVPFLGNPVAVVLDATSLGTEQMQRIARWTNLSETTFVLPPTQPGADYRVRIFTPGSELPFAGHPTLGTAHALLEAGRIAPREGRLVQECGVGLVNLTVAPAGPQGPALILFEMPAAAFTPLDAAQLAALEAALGAPVRRDPAPLLVDAGPRWLVAELASAAAVLAVQPDFARIQALDAALHSTGVVIYGEHPAGQASRIEVRAFAPSCGIAEDPVCGSGNGCVAAFVRHTGQLERIGRDIVSTQGGAIGRAGVLRLNIGDDAIRVGGASVTCVEGSLAL
jgi:PhzF family phenazine biosynthesis protein